MTPPTEDVKKAMQGLFAVLQLSMWGWFHTFFSKKVGPSICYKVTARASKKKDELGPTLG